MLKHYLKTTYIFYLGFFPCFFLINLVLASTDSPDGNKQSYLDARLPVDQRVELLLKEMTLEEKIGQMCQYTGEPEGMTVGIDDLAGGLKEESLEHYKHGIERKARLIQEGKIGSFLKIPGAAAVNYLQSAAEQSRLKIPLLMADDAIHGHGGYVGPATIFPTNIGTASSFDLSLAERIGRATAREMRATGFHWTFCPNLDIVQDQRWGRTGETFGEDPLLAGRMGRAMVIGYQNPYPHAESVLACIKHLVGGGVAFSGINGSESYIPELSLETIHYPPYITCIDANARTLMVAHNALNGIPCHAHYHLMTEVLRNRWGFDGIIISDWHDVENMHTKLRTAVSFKEACGQAVNAGIDVHMQGPGFFEHVCELVKEDVISEKRIDDSVRRILKAKFELGLFENRYVDVEQIGKTLLCPEHRELALEAARKSQVLLKNEENLLPLKKTAKRIFVTGSLADNQCQLGDWARAQPDENVITLLDGIRQIVSPETEVDYFDCGTFADIDAAAIAEVKQRSARADYTIIAAGENSLRWSKWKTSGENRDTTTLTLPGRQRELIEAALSTGKPTVLVLINSRAMAIKWCAEHVPAILEAWEPGLYGGQAAAEILFGDVNPSGKLPITFPRSVGHLRVQYYRTPMRLDKYADDVADPLFEFGHGLSYTRYQYTNLTLPHQVGPGEKITIQVDVTNAGERDGDETVLLFVNDVISSVTTPMKELKGFQRLSLKAGETKTAVFELDPMALSLVNAEMKRVVEPGRFEVFIGSEKGTFEVVDSPSALSNQAAKGIDEAIMSQLGWKVAIQCYTYKDMTLFEALDEIQRLGIHYVELLARQRVAKDISVRSGPDMDANTLAKVKAKLAATGIRAAAVWVDPLPKDEAGLRKLFAWAKELGIETVTTEPDPTDAAALALTAKLCAEYQVKIAVHNHGKPSTYWNPEFALTVAKDYGPWIGLCPDTGHWYRSGLSAVDSLRKVEGHIVSLHYKDLDTQKHDVPLGTGINDAAGQLAELKRQGFKGVITLEYEQWGPQQHGDLLRCVDFLNRQAALVARHQ